MSSGGVRLIIGVCFRLQNAKADVSLTRPHGRHHSHDAGGLLAAVYSGKAQAAVVGRTAPLLAGERAIARANSGQMRRGPE